MCGLKSRHGWLKHRILEQHLIKLRNHLRADLNQGMANSQKEPWNNLWADLSQGMANSQNELWNNLRADLNQGMANSQMDPVTTSGLI